MTTNTAAALKLVELVQDQLAAAIAGNKHYEIIRLEELLTAAGIRKVSDTVTVTGKLYAHSEPYSVTFKPRKNARYAVIALEALTGEYVLISQSATYGNADTAADRLLSNWETSRIYENAFITEIPKQYTNNN
jgi:hypothetical protein